jgi:hypothetical protein
MLRCVLLVEMRVPLAVFALLLIHGSFGLELQATLEQTFEESNNGNNSLCDHSTLDHSAAPEKPSGCLATAVTGGLHSSADEDRQSAETTPSSPLSSKSISHGAFVPEKFSASKMMSLMLAPNETLLLRGVDDFEDCGQRQNNCSNSTSAVYKYEEDYMDITRDQLAFYLTVFYLSALMGASFIAFYCICRFRGNTLPAPDHRV